MGKGPAPRPWKPSWKDQQTGRGGEDQSKKWDYWPGSWRSPRRENGGIKGAGKNQSTAFPAYDSRKPPEEDMTPVQVRRTGTATPTPLVQAVQGAVNFARKLDMRQIKLAKELSDRQKCWRGYQADMKRSYAKEKVRFEHDQSRLKEDLQKITAQQAQAYQLIQEAAAKGVPLHAAAQQAGEEEWDALVCDEEGDVPMDTTEQYLESLKRRFEEDKAPRAEPMSARPFKDPYMTSPSSTHFGPATEAGNTAEATTPERSTGSPSPSKLRPGPYQRPSVKQLPQKVHHAPGDKPTLSDKLNGKRQALGVFGRPPDPNLIAGTNSASGKGNGGTNTSGSHEPVNITDDELHDSTSPGFGTLE
ncbi:hypothetical protein AK812_SmicGene2816 [Symbiodinium microadriaticum]|uniref:Uncharacterized protein n=1 Tax=Symbiodinium microadriaticum TaxID=2951 RepID=A0A1Q9F0Q5_SYMMI|nr:hypothetical protein AK812_SmicGene2816 [Symbiodinium microadriaticum]